MCLNLGMYEWLYSAFMQWVNCTWMNVIVYWGKKQQQREQVHWELLWDIKAQIVLAFRGFIWALSLSRYMNCSLPLNLPGNMLPHLKTKGYVTWALCFGYEVTIFIAWWMNIWSLLIKALCEITLNIFISLINALNILRFIEKDS